MAANTEFVGGFGVQAEVHAHDFLLLGNPEAHGLVDGEGDDCGHHCGVGDGDAGRGELGPQLGESAAVEQAAANTVGREGDEAQCHGADDARDEVDTDDVERVVKAPAELEADGQGGSRTGDQAEAQGADQG